MDMLADRVGLDKAIDYIKDCALSDIKGDCKLIEEIYAVQNSFFVDKKNTTVTYRNESNESITENKETFGRKLANNLQNSYLKGVNYLIIRNLNQKTNPNKFLDDYDIMTWNKHIYQLSDDIHRRKFINKLNIPTKC